MLPVGCRAYALAFRALAEADQVPTTLDHFIDDPGPTVDSGHSLGFGVQARESLGCIGAPNSSMTKGFPSAAATALRTASHLRSKVKLEPSALGADCATWGSIS